MCFGRPRASPQLIASPRRSIKLGLDFRLVALNPTVFAVVGLGIAGVMVTLLAGRSLRNLARKEPAAPRR